MAYPWTQVTPGLAEETSRGSSTWSGFMKNRGSIASLFGHRARQQEADHRDIDREANSEGQHYPAFDREIPGHRRSESQSSNKLGRHRGLSRTLTPHPRSSTDSTEMRRYSVDKDKGEQSWSRQPSPEREDSAFSRLSNVFLSAASMLHTPREETRASPESKKSVKSFCSTMSIRSKEKIPEDKVSPPRSSPVTIPPPQLRLNLPGASLLFPITNGQPDDMGDFLGTTGRPDASSPYFGEKRVASRASQLKLPSQTSLHGKFEGLKTPMPGTNLPLYDPYNPTPLTSSPDTVTKDHPAMLSKGSTSGDINTLLGVSGDYFSRHHTRQVSNLSQGGNTSEDRGYWSGEESNADPADDGFETVELSHSAISLPPHSQVDTGRKRSKLTTLSEGCEDDVDAPLKKLTVFDASTNISDDSSGYDGASERRAGVIRTKSLLRGLSELSLKTIKPSSLKPEATTISSPPAWTERIPSAAYEADAEAEDYEPSMGPKRAGEENQYIREKRYRGIMGQEFSSSTRTQVDDDSEDEPLFILPLRPRGNLQYDSLVGPSQSKAPTTTSRIVDSPPPHESPCCSTMGHPTTKRCPERTEKRNTVGQNTLSDHAIVAQKCSWCNGEQEAGWCNRWWCRGSSPYYLDPNNSKVQHGSFSEGASAFRFAIEAMDRRHGTSLDDEILETDIDDNWQNVSALVSSNLRYAVEAIEKKSGEELEATGSSRNRSRQPEPVPTALHFSVEANERRSASQISSECSEAPTPDLPAVHLPSNSIPWLSLTETKTDMARKPDQDGCPHRFKQTRPPPMVPSTPLGYPSPRSIALPESVRSFPPPIDYTKWLSYSHSPLRDESSPLAELEDDSSSVSYSGHVTPARRFPSPFPNLQTSNFTQTAALTDESYGSALDTPLRTAVPMNSPVQERFACDSIVFSGFGTYPDRAEPYHQTRETLLLDSGGDSPGRPFVAARLPSFDNIDDNDDFEVLSIGDCSKTGESATTRAMRVAGGSYVITDERQEDTPTTADLIQTSLVNTHPQIQPPAANSQIDVTDLIGRELQDFLRNLRRRKAEIGTSAGSDHAIADSSLSISRPIFPDDVIEKFKMLEYEEEAEVVSRRDLDQGQPERAVWEATTNAVDECAERSSTSEHHPFCRVGRLKGALNMEEHAHVGTHDRISMTMPLQDDFSSRYIQANGRPPLWDLTDQGASVESLIQTHSNITLDSSRGGTMLESRKCGECEGRILKLTQAMRQSQEDSSMEEEHERWGDGLWGRRSQEIEESMSANGANNAPGKSRDFSQGGQFGRRGWSEMGNEGEKFGRC